VWSFFAVLEGDKSKVKCLARECQVVLSRGTTVKNFSTTPLSNHLVLKHPIEWASAKAERARLEAAAEGAADSESESGTPGARKDKARTQARLDEPGMMVRQKWSINHPNSIKLHKKLVRMLAVDNQPFSMVDDQGFIDFIAALNPSYPIPSRKYVTKMLSAEYEEVRKMVQERVDKAVSMSFTSDIWSDTTSNVTFISLSGLFAFMLCLVALRHCLNPEKSR
jgi:hypothetical protein